MMIINIIIPGKTVGFCPELKITDGVLSVWGFVRVHGVLSCGVLLVWVFVQWGFVLWGFVSVGFVQWGFVLWGFVSVGFCPVGFSPLGFFPVGFVRVGFCPVCPVGFCQGGVLSCGVLSCGFCPGDACYWLKIQNFITVCRHLFKFSRYYDIIIIIHCKKRLFNPFTTTSFK